MSQLLPFKHHRCSNTARSTSWLAGGPLLQPSLSPSSLCDWGLSRCAKRKARDFLIACDQLSVQRHKATSRARQMGRRGSCFSFFFFFGREKSKNQELDTQGFQPLAGPLCTRGHSEVPPRYGEMDSRRRPSLPSVRSWCYRQAGVLAAMLCGWFSEPGHRRGSERSEAFKSILIGNGRGRGSSTVQTSRRTLAGSPG